MVLWVCSCVCEFLQFHGSFPSNIFHMHTVPFNNIITEHRPIFQSMLAIKILDADASDNDNRFFALLLLPMGIGWQSNLPLQILTNMNQVRPIISREILEVGFGLGLQGRILVLCP